MGMSLRRMKMQADGVRYTKQQITHFVYSIVTCYMVYESNKCILLP